MGVQESAGSGEDGPDRPGAAGPVPGTTPHWRLRLLGAFDLRDATSGRIIRLPGRSASALLACLAIAPRRGHAREELVERLWPGVAPAVSRNRLRHTLSILRAVLRGPDATPAIEADRMAIRLVDGALSCDAVRFEALAREGRAAEALALYQGELLPGHYGDWANDERRRLAALADRLAAAAQPGGARRLERLPRYLTRSVGVESTVARLRRTLTQHRLVTLVGPGGLGKTRLAVAAALAEVGDRSTTPDRRSDRVEFVPLAACHTPADVLDAMLLALQVDLRQADAQAALVEALDQPHALIVLDNCEQLAPGCGAMIAALAERLPRVRWLITSRRALGLDGEREFPVPPLPLPEPRASLAELARNPAVALLIDRAQAVREGVRLDDDHAADMVRIVRLLEGVPLAIELAATRLRTLTPARLLQRLQARDDSALALLSRQGPRSGHDPRHASMVEVIAWSWALLAPAAQRLLAALSVFGGSFGADAVDALAGPGEAAPDLLLDELVQHSMLRAPDADGRFALYEPIREFAAGTLSAETARAHRARHRAWMVQWARALRPGPSPTEVRRELPNVVAALASAVADHAPQDACELFNALQEAFGDLALPPGAMQALDLCARSLAPSKQRAVMGASLARAAWRAGDCEMAERHVATALAELPRDGLARAQVLARIAHVRWRQRSGGEVSGWLDEALTLAKAADHAGLQASVLAIQGAIQRPKNPDRAAQLQRRAIAAWLCAGDGHGVRTGRHNLALALAAAPAGREEALRQLEAMLGQARAAEDWGQVGFGLNLRGEILCRQRRWADAATAYRESIRTSDDALEVLPLAYGLWNLPRALAHLGDGARAARLMGFAVQFWRTRFGPLSVADTRELRRVERLVAARCGASAAAAALADGATLSLPQAVRLAVAVGSS